MAKDNESLEKQIPGQTDQIPATPNRGIDFKTLISTQPLEDRLGIFIEGVIATEVTTLTNGRTIRVDGGKVLVDHTALMEEKKKVLNYLKVAIEEGNEAEVSKFLWYLDDQDSPEVVALRAEIQTALQQRNAQELKLNSLQVSLPIDQIAQRQLIKKALQMELPRYPFVFKNAQGRVLNPSTEVDFVFMRQSDSFKLVVGSKEGIEAISFPESLSAEQFQPDLSGITPDPKTRTIKIPMKGAADGESPSAGVIVVKKGKIDLQQTLLEEEEEQEQSRPVPDTTTSYSPPPPSVSQPRASRPSSYISVSH